MNAAAKAVEARNFALETDQAAATAEKAELAARMAAPKPQPIDARTARIRRAEAVEAAQNAGETPDTDDAKWFEGYSRSAEWRGHKRAEKALAPLRDSHAAKMEISRHAKSAN